MRAIRPMKQGGPEVLVLTDVPTPVPGNGEVLCRVEAAGVNPIDIVIRSGSDNHEPPFLLGVEGAGKVEAIGADALGFKIGDRVAWLSAPGSYATHVIAKADALVPLPDDIDARTAASVMIHGVMGHLLTGDAYRLGPGSTCLIFAALMGTAPALSQIAKRRGADVIAVVPGRAGNGAALAHGAKYVLHAASANVAEFVAQTTKDRGVDVVYDQLGAKTIQLSMALVKPRGMVVLFGHLTGPGPRFDARGISEGSIFVTRPKLKDYVETREELLARTTDVFAWVREGSLRIGVEAAFPLGAARLAHQRYTDKSGSGKILLIP